MMRVVAQSFERNSLRLPESHFVGLAQVHPSIVIQILLSGLRTFNSIVILGELVKASR